MKREYKMLKRTITSLTIVAFIGILVLTAAPVKAALYAEFFLGDLQVENIPVAGGDPQSSTMHINGTVDSSLRVYLMDTLDGPLDDPHDAAKLLGSDLGDPSTLIDFDLALTRNGLNDWEGTGTMTIVDKNGIALDAQFTSDLIVTREGAGTKLNIEGGLFRSDGDPIIWPDEEPWVYEGISEPAGFHNEADGVDNQITMPGREFALSGQVITITIISGSNDLSVDYLLQNDWTKQTGEANVTVNVPVPAAVILGMIGLGIVGTKLRRYA